MTIDAISGLDHFVIRAPDLDLAEAALQRLGFILTPRGFHVGRGSANHTVALQDGNYFELLYFPPDQPSPFGAARDRVAGPVAVALQTSDSRAVHAELAQAGHVVAAPRDLSRPVRLPDGEHLARFLNVGFPELKPAALSVFACQQLTRDLVWRPEWQAHPNGALGVTELVVVATDPVALYDSFAALFGDVALQHDEALIVRRGSLNLRLITPREFRRLYPGVEIPPDLSRGWFAGATIRVASRARLLDLLRDAGIAAITPADGRVIVQPADAVGTVLAFVEIQGA